MYHEYHDLVYPYFFKDIVQIMKIGVVEFHAASRCCWNFSPSRKKSLFRSPQAPGPWFFDLWEWSFHVISGIFVYGCHLYSLNTSFLSLNMLNAKCVFFGWGWLENSGEQHFLQRTPGGWFPWLRNLRWSMMKRFGSRKFAQTQLFMVFIYF